MGDTTRIAGDTDRYLGKVLLVGITWQNEQGQPLRKQVLHGRIVHASEASIIIERGDGGARVSLPPELQQARPGAYELSDGEVIESPDYVARWKFDERLWNNVMLDEPR